MLRPDATTTPESGLRKVASTTHTITATTGKTSQKLKRPPADVISSMAEYDTMPTTIPPWTMASRARLHSSERNRAHPRSDPEGEGVESTIASLSGSDRRGIVHSDDA